jgi:hypothetical protein
MMRTRAEEFSVCPCATCVQHGYARDFGVSMFLRLMVWMSRRGREGGGGGVREVVLSTRKSGEGGRWWWRGGGGGGGRARE